MRALRKTGLLERPGQEHFGHLTELVRTALEVPVAIISIVDEHRQVFAGHCGLPEPWASMGETPISHSFCQTVVETGDVLRVTDAPNDTRVRDNPAIVDLGVVAYLGVPIRLPSGELAGALAAIDTSVRQWTEQDLQTLLAVARVVDKEIRVGTSELKYRMLIEDMREGFYAARSVRDDLGVLNDIVIEEVNPGFARLTGMPAESAVGAHLSALAPDVLEAMLPVYRQALDTGNPETSIIQARGNQAQWFETRVRALDGEHLVAFFSDVSKRVLAQREQELRNLEIRHRLKNNLALVQAIAGQTLRSDVARHALDVFDQRLMALSSAHDVLFEQHWSGAPLLTVLQATLGKLGVLDRFSLAGPEVVFAADATLSASLLVHELATNAVKYGALSVDAGRVEVNWVITGDDDHAALQFSWRESAGPPANTPGPAGFGSRLIHMGLSGAAGVNLDFRPSGLAVSMSAPLARLQATGGA